MLQLKETLTRRYQGRDVPARLYTNSETGATLVTLGFYTDRQQQTWWQFEDLFAVPFVRQLAAKRVIDLYGHGLGPEDLRGHLGELKGLLRGQDAERYEKAYAKVLELEQLTLTHADPVKQCIGLCTVYLLRGDEDPDTYRMDVQAEKMSYLAVDYEAQAFFLNWWTVVTADSGKLLKQVSKIASTVKAAVPSGATSSRPSSSPRATSASSSSSSAP